MTARRDVSFAQIELDDVRRIKDAAGVTINDVVLSVCAAALRSHLEDQGGIPGQPLVAAVPVSVRTDDQAAMTSNHLSAMLVELGTTINEPMTRLHAIAASSRAAKTQHQVLGPATFSQLADVTPPALIAASARWNPDSTCSGAFRRCATSSCRTSPGPRFPLYCAGARMVAAFPAGPLGLGTALNITVQSYLDTLWFGIVACPDVVPAPETLAAGIHDAVHELGKERAFRRG